MQLIDKTAVVAEIERIEYETNYEPFTDEVLGKRNVCRKIREFLDTLEVKEVDLEEIIEQTYYDRSVADTSDIDHVTYENIAEYFFELGLKQSSSDEFKLGESQILLEDDGGEPPYDGKEWLDLSCKEYEIPYDKFKDGDKIEIFIRKIKKGE